MAKRQGMLDRRKFMLGMAGFSLISWAMPEAKAFRPFTPFSFAFVTDVHLANNIEDSFELVHESQLFLQQLIKELNAERVDFVMFGGDQVQTIGKDECNWNLFLDCLQPLNSAWSFVLGDKDVSGPIPVDKYKTYGRDWKLVGVQGENAYWSQNPKGVPDIHVVGLDTSLPNTTLGGMSKKQLDWLKGDLEANKDKFTMVFCHHPLLPPPPYDGGPPWDEYVIPDGGAVREVLGGFPNVKMVVSGHVHVSKVQVERDIWHISSPSLAVYPCAYRIFHVSPDMVTMETRSIDFPALIKKARKELAGSILAQRFNQADPNSFVQVVDGQREDRDALIPMRGQQLKAYDARKARKLEEKVKEKEPEPETKPESAASAQNASKKAEHPEQPEETRKRGWFRRKEAAGEDTGKGGRKQAEAGSGSGSGSGSDKDSSDDTKAPAGKPAEIEPVKDVDEELNKQLQMNDNKPKEGAQDK